MTRYWKLISILIVIVLSVGTFYIKSVLATSSFPQVLIKKQSGNEQEMESVVISGNYIDGYNYEQLTIDLEGIEYWSDKSFFAKVNGRYLPLEIQKLRKEYWNFTRGKTSDTINYYEDDAFLAYSNISFDRSYEADKYTFNISVLDKQTNKTTSFDINVPNSEAYSWVSTGSVQMVGDELKVITRNDSRDNNELEYHLYTFDIATKKLVEGEVLMTVPFNNTDDSQVMLLQERTIQHGNKQAIFSKYILGDLEEKEQETEEQTQGDEITEEVRQKEVVNVELLDVELLVYHFATGEMETLEIPETLQEYDLPYIYEGSNIFFTRTNETQLEIVAYDIDSKQVETTTSIELPNIDIGLQAVDVNNGKIYGVIPFTETNNAATIFVVNLKTGETLYQGEIVIDDSTKNGDAKKSIGLHEIEFK